MAREIVGEIFLNVLPRDAGVGPGVQKIINSAEANAAKVPISADTKQAEESVARLSGSIQDGLGGAFAQAAVQAAGFTAAVYAIDRAVKGTIGKFSGLFDQLAQAQAGFTAILGSEASGARLLDEIREFARVSPFVTQQLVNYSQQLLGVGQSAESIVPLLKSTGDLIASVGGDTQNISRVLFTLTQIRSIGRLVGQDAIQLQSSLVPITKLLADFLGKTTQEVKKLQEQGSISADTVFAAITNAGSKVEGAMSKATRNIGGAQAVLNDTVTILFQNSEALRAIFDDIFQGILAFSEALNDEDFLEVFNAVTEGIGGLYDSLKPVFEGFSGAAAIGALNSLSILASALEALGTAVSAIPEAGLKAIGIALAALAALKAPLMLLNYAKSLQVLGGAISPTGLGRSVTSLTTNLKVQEAQLDATTAATQRAASGYATLGKSAKVAAGGAAVAGLVVGQSLSGTDNPAQNLLGGALTGASLGAATTGFNPFGIAAGAGIGIVTSLISNARAAAQAKADELEQVGLEMANRLIGGFLATSPGGFTSASAFNQFFGEEGIIGAIETDIETAKREVADLVKQRDAAFREVNTLLSPTVINEQSSADVSDRIKEITTTIREFEEGITSGEERLSLSKTQLDAAFAEDTVVKFFGDAAAKLAELNKTEPLDPDLFKPIKDLDTGEFLSAADAVKQFGLVTGQVIPKTREEFLLLDAGLAKVGITASDLNRTVDELILLSSTELPDALKRTRVELEEVRLKFEESKKAATEFFAPFKVELDLLKSSAEQTKKFSDTFTALTTGGRDAVEAQAFAAEVYASAQSVFQATQLATGDAAKGAAASAEFLASTFNTLKETLGLTEEQFKDFLIQAGLWGAYQATINTDSGFVGNITELSEVTGVAETHLINLLGLATTLDNKELNIIVNTELEGAISQLGILESNLDGLSADGVERATAKIRELEKEIRILNSGIRTVSETKESGIGLSDEELAVLARRAGSPIDTVTINNQFRSAQGAARREAERIAAEQAEEARREAERLAEEAAREAEARAREAEALANTIRSAGENLTSAIQTAADAIKSAADGWEASIRERTQFERGLSASRLITNTGRQVADLTELDAGIQALIQRGLSPEAIAATGIDNVTDLRQVRKLLQANPADLAQLSALVAQRDDASERIAERAAQEQTKNTMITAIVEAARILGFEIDRERAIQVAAQFTINADTDSAQFGSAILDQLLASGQLART